MQRSERKQPKAVASMPPGPVLLHPTPGRARDHARLGDEEEAWCRREREARFFASLHRWLHERAITVSRSGCPLADDEDAWARR